MKYIRNKAFPAADMEESQSEISDELAELWIKNGNTEISNEPWSGIPFVQCYTVVDGPARDLRQDFVES